MNKVSSLRAKRSNLAWIATSRCVLLAMTASCSLAPDFKMPDAPVPPAYKEQPAALSDADKGSWAVAKSLEKEDRGKWWKIFDDAALDAFEEQAAAANQSLKIAAARVEEARATARANNPSLLPDLDIGANAVRAQPSTASASAFGVPAAKLAPYTMYTGQGVLSYEADIFGRVRDNYRAYSLDADAQVGAYLDVLLALEADVAQAYFSLRSLDSQRALLREAVTIREEEVRITTHQFAAGEIGEQDKARAEADLADVKAELLALDQQRAQSEHALAVLLGKVPAEYSFAEAPLGTMPPEIPAGLPSSLLERRPDIAAAQDEMAAANARIGVARTAFSPQLTLTASGGFQSTQLGDLFHWSSRNWALGQVAGTALTMPIFDNGRNMAGLDFAHASYDESVATYRQQVLVAFRDVEDNLSAQRLLTGQLQQQDIAAAASARTADLTEKRYHEGDVAYKDLADAQRDSLNAQRAAVQVRGQRFSATVGLIHALGGGWDDAIQQAEITGKNPQIININK